MDRYAVDRYAAREVLSLAGNGLLVRNERGFLPDDKPEVIPGQKRFWEVCEANSQPVQFCLGFGRRPTGA